MTERLSKTHLQQLAPPLLAGVADASVEAMLEAGKIRKTHSGEILLHQGDECQYLALVLDGALTTLRQNADGEEVIFRLIGRGQTCMDAIMFIPGDSPITVRCGKAGRILAIPRQTVEALMKTDAVFNRNMLETVSRFYQSAMLQIEALTIKNAHDRVGYYLLNRYIEAFRPQDFSLDFRKGDIALHLGISRETLSRVLAQFQEESIDISNKKIHLKHPQALCQFCDLETQSLCGGRNNSGCPFTH